MKFRKFTFSLLSPLVGFHYGRNPVSNARFLHVAPLPFFGIDFYWPKDEFAPFGRSTLDPGCYKGRVADITVEPDGSVIALYEIEGISPAHTITHHIRRLQDDDC